MTLACTKMFLESDRKQQPRVSSFFTPEGAFFCFLPSIDKNLRIDIMSLLFPAREKLTKDGFPRGWAKHPALKVAGFLRGTTVPPHRRHGNPELPRVIHWIGVSSFAWAAYLWKEM